MDNFPAKLTIYGGKSGLIQYILLDGEVIKKIEQFDKSFFSNFLDNNIGRMLFPYRHKRPKAIRSFGENLKVLPRHFVAELGRTGQTESFGLTGIIDTNNGTTVLCNLINLIYGGILNAIFCNCRKM